jgi:hypothetical protein
MGALTRRVLAPAAVASVFCCSAAAGNYMPPPGDYAAQWLSNSEIALTGADDDYRSGVHVVDVDAEPPQERLIAQGRNLLVSPSKQFFAFTVDPPRSLVVSAADGSREHTVFDGTAQPAGWLSDSSKLILAVPDTLSPYARLYSVRPDGSDLVEYPAGVRGVPSPDGSLFAYEVYSSAPTRIHVVTADGASTTTIVTHSAGGDSYPVWSPDGTRLAFWSRSGGAKVDLAVARGGAGIRRVDVSGTGAYGSVVWSADGGTIYASTIHGLLRLDLASGERRLISSLPGGVLSPDGSRIAYTAGGECRDRVGIYVANVDGSGARRVSNSCRITGTDDPDVLHGSFSQVVVGLGGDDTLYADDTYYYSDGDTLYGGPGDDTLNGGFARDILYGGPGKDTLFGGASKDILVGGGGSDHIYGGGGNDTIGAQDGERDWITCGTNGPGSGIRDHDVVYADRIDTVARDCEIVHRRL